jgi:hypothetical protein
MKTSSAKAKGRALQQYCRDFLSGLFDWSDGDVESRSMGSAGVDLMMSPRARKDFPFSIECKNTKKFPSIGALNQSYANSNKGTLPCVVWKPFGKGVSESIIYFRFEDFATTWKEVNAKPKED